jgi:hypothetical protein
LKKFVVNCNWKPAGKNPGNRGFFPFFDWPKPNALPPPPPSFKAEMDSDLSLLAGEQVILLSQVQRCYSLLFFLYENESKKYFLTNLFSWEQLLSF